MKKDVTAVKGLVWSTPYRLLKINKMDLQPALTERSFFRAQTGMISVIFLLIDWQTREALRVSIDCFPGVLTKILFAVLITLILMTQVLQILLNNDKYDQFTHTLEAIKSDIKSRQRDSPDADRSRNDTKSVNALSNNIIIYSYNGIQDLPLGDLIPKTLQKYPEMFYLHQPLKSDFIVCYHSFILYLID